MSKVKPSPRRRRTPGAGRPPSRAGDGLPPQVTELLARFRVVFRATREHNHRIEQACGIGGTALRALAIVASAPGMRVTELARALMVRQPTASQIVDELVEAGLVVRRRAARDLRAIELRTTAKARGVLARAPGPPIGVLPAALAALAPSDRAKLGAALDLLIGNLALRDAAARFHPIAQL
jgi:DNA-binding MarR family transcriptional regulator